ncbi:zona pellucida-binding protein 1 isoform X2 [Paroedura picta]|uniref:zona pellucida-binding protein 1 isoform X2 n=1 Tax=Paroedura picta TaxID=143630 RepID=UPI0040567277
MRGRRRRRRSRPSSALSGPRGRLLGLACILALALPSVHCSSVDSTELKVVGSTNLPVKVYVKMNHNSPRILCITSHLRDSELIDPIFQWHGPGGDIVTENKTVKITPTGTLLFRHFNPELSGVYTCSLVFKPTTEQAEKSYLIKYVIYGYSDPNFHYEFTARYHAAPCNSIYNTSFEKKLLQILSKLVVGLSCEIALLKSECHHVKMQRAGLQNVIFFTFTVSSLETEKVKSTCEQTACDTSRRLRKAKDLIEKFFSQQVEVLGKRTAPLPEIYYIEGTLQMVWVSRCYPGYGINALQHPDCPHCCVVCSPGSYNPREGVHCLQCNKSLAYGAKTC